MSPRLTIVSADINSRWNISERRQSCASVATARTTGCLPIAAPKSVSSPQIAITTPPGTPNCCSMRDISAACRLISDRALAMRALTRGGPNCSKVFLNTPCRRSSWMTRGSGVRPSNAAWMTRGEIFCAAASREKLDRKASKLPPQGAVSAGAACSSAMTIVSPGVTSRRNIGLVSAVISHD